MDKTKHTPPAQLHPLEESVLSLAAGNIAPSEPEQTTSEEIQDNLRVLPGTAQAPAQPEPETAEKPPEQKITAVAETINQCMDFINKKVLGRRETIRQAFLALLTGEHQLLISRTGMAKSLLARQIFSCFQNAQIFEKQLTKDTMPENLFGAYDIEAMKKGKMIHNVEGTLVLSHFAFLDEIFDANDMLLRSLLSLLNEKQLVNGEQVVYSTLHSVIAAANYIRLTEVLEAVVDRFLYKSFIPENKELYFQYSIDQVYQQHFGEVCPPERRLSLGELSLVKKTVQSRQIPIPGYVLFLKNYILKKYIEETRNMVSDKKDFTISDRKSVKIQDTLRACALLDGRYQVEEQDLDKLYYAVCTLGRDEEVSRLNKITAAARNYFRQDRHVLENVFSGIEILALIAANKNNEVLKSDAMFAQIRQRLEDVTRTESSVFREYIHKIKKTFLSLTRDTYLPETFTVLDNLCDMSLKNARAKETRDIVSEFRKDAFNEKKILGL